MLGATNEGEYLSVTTNDNYTVNALNGNDIITTLGGDDIINAGDGNNIIKTNSGNDTITGGSGSDIYEFKKGYGQDIIISSGNLAIDKDIIKFVDETIADDLEFHKKVLL